MKKTKTYENFPLWIVALTNLFSLSIYLIGLYIFSRFGILFAVFFALYIIWTEFRLVTKSCRNCYYYGKFCAFGRGKCCSLLFKKGSPKRFVKRKVTMKDLIPDFLLTILPMIAGAILLIYDFSWCILALIAFLIVFGFFGNAVIRSSFACKYCKQRKIGCPAEKLFKKKNK
ncbi:MAG: hypothetical protein ABIE55_04065 [Candidatus Aenigmatarchaeota archaeon]